MANADAVIQRAAAKYGIDPKILMGVYGTETSFGKNVTRSSAGAVGPFQLEPSTAASLGVKDPNNFREAALGAARYLAQYKGRGVAGMLSAYNAGPAGGLQPSYVASVLKNGNVTGVTEPSQSTRAALPGRSQGVGQARAPVSANPHAKGLDFLAQQWRSQGGGTLADILEAKAEGGVPGREEGASTPKVAGATTGPTTFTGVPAGPKEANVKLPPPAASPKVATNLPAARQKYGVSPKIVVPPGGFNIEPSGPHSNTALETAPVIARHPAGNVVKQPGGPPIFMPHKRQ
jgi:hypothetical protein